MKLDNGDELVLIPKGFTNDISKEKSELLQALKDLWNVRREAFTSEEAEIKFNVECRVEDILDKY